MDLRKEEKVTYLREGGDPVTRRGKGEKSQKKGRG